WCIRNIQILRCEFIVRVATKLRGRSASIQVIVVERNLPNGARKRDRQFSRWRDIAEKHVAYRRAAHRAWMPRVQHRVHLLRHVMKGKRPPGKYNGNGWLTDLDDFRSQFLLCSGQVQECPRACLSREARFFTKKQQSDVGTTCRLPGTRKSVVTGIARVLETLRRGYSRLAQEPAHRC